MVLSFGRWEVHCATRVFCQEKLLILFCLEGASDDDDEEEEE